MKRKIKFETHDNNNNNLTEFNHGPLHKNTNNNILTTRARARDFHLPNVTRRSYTYYCKLLDYLQIQVVKHTFLFPQYTEKKYFLNAVWRNNEAVKNMTGLTWLDPSFDKELNSFFFQNVFTPVHLPYLLSSWLWSLFCYRFCCINIKCCIHLQFPLSVHCLSSDDLSTVWNVEVLE